MKCIKLVILFSLLPLLLLAHEIRPAYLSITQVSDTNYTMVWKLPARGTAAPAIYPTIPTTWNIDKEETHFLGDNLKRRYAFSTSDTLQGQSIYFEGQQTTLIDILVTIKLLDGTQYSALIKPSNPNYTIPFEPSKLQVVKTYSLLGVEHILFGIDHLLFVFALLLLTTGFGKLVKTITAFTVAHSITLSLAALGIVGLPGPPVEAAIALSIVLLAVELYHRQRGKESLTTKYPWMVAFSFGLLHGFGFAGALNDIGLPQIEIPAALLFFNVGVEVGQIAFVIVVISLLWGLQKLKKEWPAWVERVPPYLIGGVASFWLIERVVGFF